MRTDVLSLAAIEASISAPPETAVRLLKAMRESLNLRTGAIYTYDEANSELSMLASSGMDERQAEHSRTVHVREGEPAYVGRAVLRRQAIMSGDRRLDSSQDNALRDAGPDGPIANIALPMAVNDRVVGALSFVFDRELPFSAEELELFTALASIVGAAIDKAAMLQELEAARERAELHAQRMSLLKELAEIGASTHRVAETADRHVHALLRGLGAAAASIWEIETAGDSLTPIASAGALPYEQGRALGPVALDSEADVAKAVRANAPSFFGDSDSMPPRAYNREAGFDSGVSLPLMVDGRAGGALSLTWSELRTFRDDEASFLESVASEVSVGLQNARLFEAETVARKDARRELETVQALLRSAEALKKWVSLDDVFAALTASLLAVIDHTRVAAFLWDAQERESTLVSSAGPEAFPVGERFRFEELSAGAREAITERKATIVDYDALPENERGPAGRLGSRLSLLVPLVQGDEVVGLIGVDDHDERREFTDREIRLAQGIASQAAVAIENARLYEVEHGIAQTLQDTLVVLPSHVPGITFSRAYESATYEKARVGGDFVDVFQVNEHVVGIALGDVSGKGIDAAVTTSLIRTTLRVHALDGMTPAKAAAKTNEMMRRFTELESYVTLWFGLLNTQTGQLRYVCAGHPPALIISAEGAVSELECRDPILGAFDAAAFYEWHTVMLQGDRLVLYSDGVIEAKSSAGSFLGADGWLEIIDKRHEQPTTGLSQSLMNAVVAFSDGVLRDDAAVLTVQVAESD